MNSKITDIIPRKIPIIIKYSNGQTNIYKDALKRTDFNNKEAIEESLNKINNNQNYYPKKMKISTAILIEEE